MSSRIIIIGCGPGATDLMTIRGSEALKKADVVVGSKRLLDDFATHGAQTIVLENNYTDVLEEAGGLPETKKVVFLVSGDPMFYSLGNLIIKKLGKENCEVIPGVSSFQYAFCKLGESWKDYRLFSMHGIEGVDIEEIFRENDKFIILLDPKHNLKLIKEMIGGISDDEFTFHVASNLSIEDEELSELSFKDFDRVEEKSLGILIGRRRG